MTEPLFSTDVEPNDAFQASLNVDANDNLVLDVGTFRQVQALSKAVRTLEVFADSRGPWALPAPIHRGRDRGNWFVKLSRTATSVDLIRADSLGEIHIDPEHTLHPMIVVYMGWANMAFLDKASWHKASMPEADALRLCDDLNAQFATLHRELNQPAVREKKLQQTRASRKNLQSGSRWLDQIFKRIARLCALRIDLYYARPYGYGDESIHVVNMDEVFAHRTEFLRQLPGVFEHGILGYVLKTEYTLKRSLHHHVLIVLEHQKHSADILLADMAGDLWKRVTSGRGTYNNVNKNANRQSPTYAIGEVHVSDEQKVWNLKANVLAYLCKHDFLVRWVVPNQHKLFLKSIPKPLVGAKRGRPRKLFRLSTKTEAVALERQAIGGDE
jgi:hypothetical protein